MPDELPCETITFRTVMRAKDVQEGVVLASAFHRRDNDTRGLSVDYNVSVPEGCAAQLTGRKRAILSLHTGRVRTLGLDVVPDTPTHGNITGVPHYSSLADRELAERLATGLVEQSRIAWPKQGYGTAR